MVFQDVASNLKRRTGRAMHVKSYLELSLWALEHELPMTMEEVKPFELYAVPFEMDDFPDVEAVILTMHVQVNWVGQLTTAEKPHTAHVDGNYKVHHGDYILITYGTHVMKYDAHKKGQIRQVFRPLVYMLTKQKESSQCLHLGWHCINTVSMRFFGKPYTPGAGCIKCCIRFVL